MKKNMVRIVAALLVAMLALTLIPMGAFAAETLDDSRNGVWVQREYYETTDPSMYDYSHNWNSYGDADFYESGSKIKVKDYDKFLIIDGEMYDFSGFDDNEFILDPKLVFDSEEDYIAWAKKTDLPFVNKDISVPKDLTSKDGQEWLATWGTVFAAYTPHQHKLSYWYSDGTTHWRECLVCKKFADQGFWEQFMYQNWCQDGDEDGICNVCGGEVPYHDIKVIEVEGAKITLNRDNASHRTKITADVEAEDGYKVGKVHFVKVREDGSKQEITRYKKNGQFFTYMPTYEMEVSVDVTKK